MVDHIATRHELTEALGWGEAGIEAAGTAALAPSGGFFSFEEVDPKTGAWTNPHQMQGLGSQFRMIIGKPDVDGMSFHTWEESYPVAKDTVDAFMREHEDIFNPAIAARVEKRWRAIDALFLDGQGDDPDQLADARDVSFRDYNDYSEAEDDGDDDVLEEDEPDDIEEDEDRVSDPSPMGEQAFAQMIDLEQALDGPDASEAAPRGGLPSSGGDPNPWVVGSHADEASKDERDGREPPELVRSMNLAEASVEGIHQEDHPLRQSLVPLDSGEEGERVRSPRRIVGATFAVDLDAMQSTQEDHLSQVRVSVEQAQEGNYKGMESTIQFYRERVAWTRSVSANHLVAMIADDLTKVDLARNSDGEDSAQYVAQRFPDGSQQAGIEFDGKRDGFWVAMSEDSQRMQIGRYRQGTKEGPWLDVDMWANTVRQQDFHLGFPVRRQSKQQAVVTAGRMER